MYVATRYSNNGKVIMYRCPVLDGDKENLLTNFEVQKLAYRRGLSSKETLVGVREARKFKLVEWIDGIWRSVGAPNKNKSVMLINSDALYLLWLMNWQIVLFMEALWNELVNQTFEDDRAGPSAWWNQKSMYDIYVCLLDSVS